MEYIEAIILGTVVTSNSSTTLNLESFTNFFTKEILFDNINSYYL
jgi:hypothetical protein